MTIINELLHRSIAYHPTIAKATESAKLAILWQQIHFWTPFAKDPEGWVYKTRDELYDETGLSRHEIDTARELGEKLGVLMYKVAGFPAKVHFKVDVDRMIEILQQFVEANPLKKKESKPVKAESSMDWLKNIPDVDLRELCEKYSVTKEFVIARGEDVRDHCEAKGKKYANYKAALRNFIKSHLARNPGDKTRSLQTTSPALMQEIQEEARRQQARTPEEQARIDERLATVRKSLADRMNARK